MKLGFFLVGLFAVTMAPHGARAACDVCEMIPGDFSPGNFLPLEGQPDGTCQDIAADLEALDQNSFDCLAYTATLGMFCCGDGFPCLEEMVAFSTCVEDNDSCDACQMEQIEDDQQEDADACTQLGNEIMVENFNEAKECCPVCAEPINALAVCINSLCFPGGDSPFIGLAEEVATNGGCDLCPGASLSFVASNVVPGGAGGQPNRTCEEFATDLNVTNIDQTSAECIAGVTEAGVHCCSITSAATFRHTLATVILAGAWAIAAML